MSDKVLIISGANSQIGSYLAKRFATSDNHDLLLLYHNKKERITELLSNSRVRAISLDLLQRDKTQSELSQAIKGYDDPMLYLIHCVAMRSDDHLPLGDTTPDYWQQVLEGNVLPCYNVLKTLLPIMKRQGFGRGVVFGSSVSQSGLQNGSAYAAAKAAMVNIVASVSKEYAKHNIIFNCLSPAPVMTNLEEDYSGSYLEFRKRYFASYLASTPSGKLVSLSELFVYVNMLLSDEIENLCGQEIIVHGGGSC